MMAASAQIGKKLNEFDLIELHYEGGSDCELQQLEESTPEPSPAVQIGRITAPEPLFTERLADPIISRVNRPKKRRDRVGRSTSQRTSASRRRSRSMADHETWEVVDMSRAIRQLVSAPSAHPAPAPPTSPKVNPPAQCKREPTSPPTTNDSGGTGSVHPSQPSTDYYRI